MTHENARPGLSGRKYRTGAPVSELAHWSAAGGAGALGLLAVERIVAPTTVAVAIDELFTVLAAYSILGVAIGVVSACASFGASLAGARDRRYAVGSAVLFGALLALLLLRDHLPPVSQALSLSGLSIFVISEVLVVLMVWHGQAVFGSRSGMRGLLRVVACVGGFGVLISCTGYAWTHRVRGLGSAAENARSIVVLDVSGMGEPEFQWARSAGLLEGVLGDPGGIARFMLAYGAGIEPGESLANVLGENGIGGRTAGGVDQLRESGYETIAVVAGTPATESPRLRGFDRVERFEDEPLRYAAIRLAVALGWKQVARRRPDGTPVASEVAGAAISLLEGCRTPFFAFVQFGDLVGEWEPSESALDRAGFEGEYSGGLALRSMLDAVNQAGGDPAREEGIRNAARAAFHAVLFEMTAEIDRVVRASSPRRPIYVLTSDHAAPGLEAESAWVHFPERGIRVPLIVRAGRACRDDVNPVFLGGLIPACAALAEGLGSIHDGPQTVCSEFRKGAPDVAVLHSQDAMAVLSGEWKLECGRDGRCRLYRREQGVMGAVDVARRYPEQADRLRKVLASIHPVGGEAR